MKARGKGAKRARSRKRRDDGEAAAAQETIDVYTSGVGDVDVDEDV